MKGVQHDSIAENKGERLCLVALQQIEIELGGRIKNRSLNGWIDSVVPVQDSGYCGHADLGRGRDLPQSNLGPFWM